jgi:hypothetical protein
VNLGRLWCWLTHGRYWEAKEGGLWYGQAAHRSYCHRCGRQWIECEGAAAGGEE